jgi:hypothetical protein
MKNRVTLLLATFFVQTKTFTLTLGCGKIANTIATR